MFTFSRVDPSLLLGSTKTTIESSIVVKFLLLYFEFVSILTAIENTIVVKVFTVILRLCNLFLKKNKGKNFIWLCNYLQLNLLYILKALKSWVTENELTWKLY